MITFEPLASTSLSVISLTFNTAFANYFVPFNVDQYYLYKRWKAAGVDYKLSIGAFDGDNLIGFLVFGVREIDGILCAHNTATGVISAYRGRRLVRSMHEAALPALRVAGVKYSTLEVIEQNEIAIKAYVALGYSVKRTLRCFTGKVKCESQADLKMIKTKDIPWSLLCNMVVCPNTWESSNSALRVLAPDYECWYCEDETGVKAFAIINPESGFVARLGFASKQLDHHAQSLFAGIGEEVSILKINNIDSKESELIRFLLDAGLENHINQYEMEMTI